jgi:DNA-binding PadR family transcriptional regulator
VAGPDAPTRLGHAEFEQFVLPHLSVGSRGPASKLGFHKIFNYILQQLYLGCQWKELSIEKDGEGRPEIHYTRIYSAWRRWEADGCIDAILTGSVAQLHQDVPEVDHCIGQGFECVVHPTETIEAKQQSPELVFPSEHAFNRPEAGSNSGLRPRRHDRGGSGPGRFFAHGDLRLVILHLIAEKPRHGYEIIKAIEEHVCGAYSPSPGVICPTLTLLEELGHVTVTAGDSAKKLRSITPEGQAYLDAYRPPWTLYSHAWKMPACMAAVPRKSCGQWRISGSRCVCVSPAVHRAKSKSTPWPQQSTSQPPAGNGPDVS